MAVAATSTANLALASVPTLALVALRELLVRADEHARMLANPLFTDLDDDDAIAELDATLRRALPMLTAASALAGPTGRATDGLLVRVGASCDEAPRGSPCVALWSTNQEAARLRFAAWAYSYALVLHVDDERHRALVETLRTRALGRLGRIALVLDASGDRGERAIHELANQLGADLARARRAPGDVLTTLAANSGDVGEVRRRVGLTADEMVVVPRLGALAELPAFEQEVLDAAQPYNASVRHHATP